MYVQTLDKSGRSESKFFWIDVTDGEDVYYGWLNADGDIIEEGEMTLKVGDGLWIYAPSTSYKLQSAGQVPSSDTVTILRSGSKMVANPTPVTIDMTNIIVAGYDAEEGSEEEVYVQTLDKSGRSESKLFWIDVTDGEDVYYGWLNADGDIIEEGDVTVGPGAGLWVYAPSTAYTLKFPGVSL